MYPKVDHSCDATSHRASVSSTPSRDFTIRRRQAVPERDQQMCEQEREQQQQQRQLTEQRTIERNRAYTLAALESGIGIGPERPTFEQWARWYHRERADKQRSDQAQGSQPLRSPLYPPASPRPVPAPPVPSGSPKLADAHRYKPLPPLPTESAAGSPPVPIKDYGYRRPLPSTPTQTSTADRAAPRQW